jgi:hypothetical protein
MNTIFNFSIMRLFSKAISNTVSKQKNQPQKMLVGREIDLLTTKSISGGQQTSHYKTMAMFGSGGQQTKPPK